jgi:lysine-specific demethylase 3
MARALSPLSSVFFQVSNQADCIKAAGDFLFPDHLEHCLQLTTEFREENLLDGPWMVDVPQVKRTVLHAYTNIQEQCLGLAALERSDPPSVVNFEDPPMVLDDFQSFSPPIPLSSGHFQAPQRSGSSIPSNIDIQDEHVDAVSDIRHGMPPEDSLSPEHFPGPQYHSSSVPSDIQDEHMMDPVGDLRQDTPPRDNSSVKVS